MVDAAEVRIWGQTVGAVRWDAEKALAYFQYNDAFLRQGYNLAPLKMPLQQGSQIYSFPELRPAKDEEVATFKGLPGLLADSLPDRYGSEIINLWLAKNGRKPNSMNPVEQLCFIGKRGMGALEFEPSKGQASQKSFSIEINSLVQAAQKMLAQKSNFETNLKKEEQQALTEILKIGTSAGGARPKAVIAYNPKTGEVKSGQTLAPKNFEHWLLKLDGVSDTQFGNSHGYGRVEYAYYLMAKDCGITMMESRLLEENGRAHFMTKRFDRSENATKHHLQTFCGLQHFDYNKLYSYSYEQLFLTMRALRLSYPEAEQMFRRMVFNVMATNYDDHTKNFSFLLSQGESWKLAPAYDVCYSYNPANNWVNKHTLSLNGKHKNINLTDLLTLAEANSVKKPEQIIREIKAVVEQWSYYAQKAHVGDVLHKHIQTNLVAPNFKV
jgi:serine/threonine-protein kinase HipA